jgi:hypothetical protein
MPKINDGGISREMTSDEFKVYEEAQATIKKEQEEYLKVKYKDDRKMAYPEIGDQLDDLFRKGAFSDEMNAKLIKVKSDFPKPE